eukprot:TRINITY_DN15357_c0_g1_i1.p1 TRINITY_DN15357_c0_g1~~TRINITY_DN15357_c0_g1_i1.p1  ORF type:complete len:269 (+),score=40.47 TRINITY_DN15357_c0_g1_i1:89-895(+)
MSSANAAFVATRSAMRGPALLLVAAACAGLQAEAAAASPKRQTQVVVRESEGHEVLVLIGTLVVLFGGGVMWCLFLEYEPSTPTVRTAMTCVSLASTTFEIGLAWSGVLDSWMVWVILFTNTWGNLDCILRFPTDCNFESGCMLKQFLLQLGKVACYVAGFRTLRHDCVWFIAVVLLNLVCAPLLFILAMPLEEDRKDCCGSIIDVDLAVRLAQLLRDPADRQRCKQECTRTLRCWVASAAGVSPVTSRLLCRIDPSYRRWSRHSRTV